MKRILLLSCFLGCCHHLLAQPLKVDILAGPNLSTFVPGNGYVPIGSTTSPTFGFHAGAAVDFSFGTMHIAPGLFYELIGGNLNTTDTRLGGSNSTTTYSLQYLQAGANVIYNRSGKFFFGGGPYVAFALAGTYSNNYVFNNGSDMPASPVTEKYAFSSYDNPDIGINITAGVHVPGNFIFSIDYGFSLKALGVSNGMRSNVYSFSVGHTL